MLTDRIKSDMTAALKTGDAPRLLVLRMLVSEIGYKQIELQRELRDEDVISVIQREAKKRREAIESYREGDREDQALTEEKELEILLGYLPAQMGEGEVREEINKVLERLSTEEKSDFGKAMRVIAPMFKGRAEGAVVAKIVKEILN